MSLLTDSPVAVEIRIENPLEDRARRVIFNNPHLPHRSVQLEARDGRVTLKGVVRSFYQKQMAQESLRGLDGIAQIENLLDVQW
ncbi:MAG TPA: BON domain-containing protein [Pirellulales bacterium]|jgi:osmotically-inducible protein OsmY|nr:BON domain-containing protein [Pirellulales bacterium]